MSAFLSILFTLSEDRINICTPLFICRFFHSSQFLKGNKVLARPSATSFAIPAYNQGIIFSDLIFSQFKASITPSFRSLQYSEEMCCITDLTNLKLSSSAFYFLLLSILLSSLIIFPFFGIDLKKFFLLFFMSFIRLNSFRILAAPILISTVLHCVIPPPLLLIFLQKLPSSIAL